MNTLPQLGEVVQLFGIGCQGCGHFRGEFEVEEVRNNGVTSVVVAPRQIYCEGGMDADEFSHLALTWNREVECWEADCHGFTHVVNISGHYRGPARPSARYRAESRGRRAYTISCS